MAKEEKGNKRKRYYMKNENSCEISQNFFRCFIMFSDNIPLDINVSNAKDRPNSTVQIRTYA